MSEWIKCSDMLPEDDGRYLGMNSNGYMSVFTRLEWVNKPADIAPVRYLSAWMDTPEESFTVMDGVTHWMPLPEPPTD